MGLSEGFLPAKIWGSVTQGLLQGVTNIGLNFATQELGLNPLLANIGFSAISGAINAGIQAATGGSQNVFQTLFQTYEKNALTFLGYADPNSPGYAWQQAAYISQILDFSDIVRERGLIEALNTYGASFFNAVAVNNIVQSGVSLGQYFANKLATGQYTLKTDSKTGTQYAEVGIGQDSEYGAGLFTGNAETGWTLSGRTEVYGDTSFWGFGDIGVDAYHKMGFTDAELATVYNGIWRESQTIDGGLQVYADVCDLRGAGQQLFAITPDAMLGYNAYNSFGDYVNAILWNAEKDSYFNIGTWSDFKETLHFDDPNQIVIPEENIKAGDLEGTEIITTKDADGNIISKLVGKTTEVILENGQKAYKFLGKLFDIGASTAGAIKDYTEKVMNNMDGLALRTNDEVKLHWQDTLSAAINNAQPGDMIAGISDRTDIPGMMLSKFIKIGETSGAGGSLYKTYQLWSNPTAYIVQNIGTIGLAGYDTIVPEHTGMIVVVNGEKMVLEMGAFGQQIVSLSDFAYRYRDIEVVRPNEGGVDAAQYLLGNYFQQNTITGKLESRPDNRLFYNYLGLFGLISNRDSYERKSYICSEWYYDALKRSSPDMQTWSLPGVVEDMQISPYDLTRSSSQWGRDILEIEN